MIPFSLVRHVTAAIASLLGYPPTVRDDVRGRLLG